MTPPPAAHAPGVLRSASASVALTAVAVGLGGSASHLVPVRTVDAAVALGVLAAAALYAGVTALGALLLAIVGTARRCRRSGRRLETAARRLTPELLRRAVTVTVGAGLGVATMTGAAAGEEIDLGWVVSSSQPAAPSTAPSSAPSSSAEPPTAAAPAVPHGTGVTPEPRGLGPVAPQALEPTTDAAVDLPSPADGAVATTLPASLAGHSAAGGRTPATDAAVTVEEGDTLWSISAARLPGSPTVADIAAAWPRWYAANRDVIGPDPDLIHPGQRLTPPDAPTEEPA